MTPTTAVCSLMATVSNCLMPGSMLNMRSSPTITAKGSFLQTSRAHNTAWPRPNCFFWRTEMMLAISATSRTILRVLELAGAGQQILKGQIVVEVVLDNGLVAVGDEHHVLQARGLGFLDHVLHHRLIVDGEHFLGNVLGGRQGSCSPPGNGDDHFLDFHALLLGCALPGMRSERTGSRRCARPVRFLALASRCPRPPGRYPASPMVVKSFNQTSPAPKAVSDPRTR